MIMQHPAKASPPTRTLYSTEIAKQFHPRMTTDGGGVRLFIAAKQARRGPPDLRQMETIALSVAKTWECSNQSHCKLSRCLAGSVPVRGVGDLVSV